MTLVDRLADSLATRTDRRGFLNRVTMWGAAVVAAPSLFLLTPTTAYAAVCGCANQNCDCTSKCCDGYTEFCCTIYGENSCPPGGVIGGWWKVDGSSFCGGNARYYMDCHSACGGCTCGSTGICDGTCNGTECSCGNHDCRNRKAGCTHFRYGNCNNDVTCVGPIICRVVTCTLPWEVDSGCSTTLRVDNDTRYHDAPCLHESVDPAGHIEDVSAVPGKILVRGWALDLDSRYPVAVHFYVDGQFAGGVRTTLSRPDVQRVFGSATDVLGFESELNGAPGRRLVCAFAINVGGGKNKQIGCFDVNVPSANPVGNLELVEPADSGVRVKGWAFDRTQDSPPLQVAVMTGSTVLEIITAGNARPDVMSAFSLSDSHVGFDEIVPAADGDVTYCLRALDYGNDGRDVEIGCRRLDLNRHPSGWLDVVERVNTGVRLTGWAVDPDSTDPVAIHVYTDVGFLGGGKADAYRPDVARAMGIGDHHGFDLLLTLPEGATVLSVYAINIGPGRNKLIGRKPV